MYRKSLASLVRKTSVLPCRTTSLSYASIAICDDARAKLKEVYRKIHPDLFHSNKHARVRFILRWDNSQTTTGPSRFILLCMIHVLKKIFLVQETNEKSFKLLQDYIANANADARDRGGYGGAYDFEFYSSSTGDEKIQLTLPAPVRDG